MRVNEFLVFKGLVSPNKCYRFTADGNYCASLVERGKLIEDTHWEWSEPIRSINWYDWKEYYYRKRIFYLAPIEQLYKDGFKDDPEIWVAFNEQRIAHDGTPCQWDVSDSLHQKIVATGARWSGYDQLSRRKYYTALNLLVAQRAIDVASRFTQSGPAED